MKKQEVISITHLAFPITLTQTGKDSFTVTYGRQVKKGLNYSEAAHEFGCCVMHAAACEGLLVNDLDE